MLEMNISLIKIKYMPKKDLPSHKRSKQVKTIQKDELFRFCRVNSLLSFIPPMSFWTFIGGKTYTYTSFTIFYSALILKIIAFCHI